MSTYLYDFLFKYTWFIFGLVALTQALTVPARTRALATILGDPEETIRPVLIGVELYMAVPFFVLGLMQLLSGIDSVFYIFYAPMSDPLVLASVLFVLLWWSIGAYFVFFRGGAYILARYRIMVTGNYYVVGETGIKVFMAAILLLVAVGFIMARFFFAKALYS